VKKRTRQLVAKKYPRIISSFLWSYYRSPDHAGKLRILNILENILGNKRIVVKTIGGVNIACDKTDLIQRHLFYDGDFEPELTRLLEKEINSDDVFYDIGANVGYFSCVAKNLGAKSVVAFEPDPLTCDIIKLNFKINDIPDEDYHLFEVALSNNNGVTSFSRMDVSNTGISGLGVREGVVDVLDVEIATLDELVSHNELAPPTILKIDVEGEETRVLNGAIKTLSSINMPRLIVVEAASREDGSISDTELTSILSQHGYYIERLSQETDVRIRENYLARFIDD